MFIHVDVNSQTPMLAYVTIPATRGSMCYPIDVHYASGCNAVDLKSHVCGAVMLRHNDTCTLPSSRSPRHI